MTQKSDARREDLKARLVSAARARIQSSGLGGLRARDITADAGCALGALYTVFADLDDLVLHVNSGTLAELGAVLRTAAAGALGPEETLKALARAYLAFASENRMLWAALFEHRMAPGVPVPEWHLAEHAVLIQYLVEPLALLGAPSQNEDLLPRARAIFSAVHGIVAISLEARFIGLAPPVLERELLNFVDVLVSGLKSRH
ncbi:TetR/AcrR family transcriptional regulator [Mesorhizobium sp. WSM3860]|uniref:TetR/AcrR family transcriptional regulator n=1 Tax=Mesorhizobium sp. WSM3860 TaxID=2029403 RepID=UPI000BAF6ECA|nr:TetR/AcrR family transcriptional regulator [Mesorhizobium sp. WSM3860]PBC06278.1 TetR family transcriptional regulator [Mesorhizobium sp. WSM3860]